MPSFHLGSPRKMDLTKCQVYFGKLRENIFFRGLGGVRFPGPSKVANCQGAEDCKKYVIFRDIDGATPIHSPKSGWECPHRWRNSPHISHPSTNLTKICHIDQSYPKTEGKTTRKDIRVVPRQGAKPTGKTSELSFLGHIWRNCLLSWDNSDVFPGGFASCLGISLIDVAYFG